MRKKAIELMGFAQEEFGVKFTKFTEYLMYYILSGDEAYEAIKNYLEKELDIDLEEYGYGSED